MDSRVLERKFQLADALSLIVATAAALALIRYQLLTPRSLIPVITKDVFRFDATYPAIGVPELEVTCSLILASIAPTLLWMSLRQPRTGLGALMRQPGTWACLVSSLAAGSYLGRHVIDAWQSGWPLFEVPASNSGRMISAQLDFFPLETFPRLRAAVGPWIIAAWLSLIVLGRWRDRVGWIEVWGEGALELRGSYSISRTCDDRRN